MLIDSDSSWMWLFAAIQVDVGLVSCFPLSCASQKKYSYISRAKLSLLDSVELVSPSDIRPTTFDLLLIDLESSNLWDQVPWHASSRVALFGSKNARRAFLDRASDHPLHEKVLHRRLDGLTAGKALICWSGENAKIIS
jgi:hypothetical protein